MEREATLLYPLWNFSSSHLDLLDLNAYKCKLLILSNSLLKDITPEKCQFLEELLRSPASVVTLLCGMESSDPLFQLLSVPGSRWEISTEQEPEDYISVVSQILDRGKMPDLLCWFLNVYLFTSFAMGGMERLAPWLRALALPCHRRC